ncbi:CPBP family intramembrane glutamic endopeptidase [Microbacterium sp. MYb66]|uniref:CPBP family intramembrane glutamic endopeptidase n=1 Tax=Microbacterium sp. MYb66 TaxID=1848692 RepID=UPI000D00639E|nr:CPBP family intramembrane glutamic endopeptidase [Microbacterium sp. MYb66]PRA82016.1 CPBP family intramembrane metalloprotease [Microbacterium sp. MYb66]
MSTPAAAMTSPWKSFWEKGGWWRALLLTAVYFVLFQLLSLLLTPLAENVEEPSSAAGVVVFYVLPELIGCLILALFTVSVGWWRELFARQPIRGGGWMWIAIVVVLLFNVLRFATLDYDAAGFEVVAAWLLAGLLIGFSEEVLTRGLVVNLMRKAGYREIVVAVISAALFSALHAGNLLSGQPLLATAIQLLYTFAFGILMYLALRVTGTIIAPILLHASTDPSIFLQTAYPAEGALTGIAGAGNIVVIVTGLVLLFFIRGRVGEAKPSFSDGRAA